MVFLCISQFRWCFCAFLFPYMSLETLSPTRISMVFLHIFSWIDIHPSSALKRDVSSRESGPPSLKGSAVRERGPSGDLRGVTGSEQPTFNPGETTMPTVILEMTVLGSLLGFTLKHTLRRIEAAGPARAEAGQRQASRAALRQGDRRELLPLAE